MVDVPRSKGDQMSVVCGSGDGDGACAADVCVTQLVGQLLELVSIKMIIIPEHMIVAGAGGALDTWTLLTLLALKLLDSWHYYLDESRDRSQTPWGDASGPR